MQLTQQILLVFTLHSRIASNLPSSSRLNTTSCLAPLLRRALIQGQCSSQVLAMLILLQQRLRQATRLVLLEESTCAGVPQLAQDCEIIHGALVKTITVGENHPIPRTCLNMCESNWCLKASVVGVFPTEAVKFGSPAKPKLRHCIASI